jgi:YedE family putative selenium metabolism protein
MLRGETTPRANAVGLALLAAVGAAAAWLVAAGNPGNMGVCGACFLRDAGGALKLHSGPAIFRPEVAGLVLGAFAFSVAGGRGVGRSGSFAVARFLLGVWMAVGALVFLGCPFRTFQRLGGGDLTAWFALPGLVAGVGLGLLFERRGYSIGKTQPAPAPVALLGPLAILGLFGLFLAGGVLAGPGPGEAGKPAHAAWVLALVVGTFAGVALSATGFCGVNAMRQIFVGPRRMLLGAAVLVAAYAVVAAATGRFTLGVAGQPAAHADHLWNAAALALVGLTGALAGGCPVRQIVMTGEGNGDSFVVVAGLTVGGALGHAFGLVSAAATADAAGGPTDAGKKAVVVGLVLCAAYGFAMTRKADTPAAG